MDIDRIRIVFVSNYFNHHQKPFSDAMYRHNDVKYWFIATTPMANDRKALGWESFSAEGYVINSFESKQVYERCLELIKDADVVLYGSAPIKMIQPRLKMKKLTIRVSERLFKTKIHNPFLFILKTAKYYWKYGHYKNQYLLCCGGYAAYDYKSTGNFINKAYKWGYFPETKHYKSFDELLSMKTPASILWVGRLIEWKHPELAISLASILRNQGIPFHLTIVGDGPLRQIIENKIIDEKLESYVELVGAVASSEVRNYMQKSEIFIFTSDQNEGWGAVLNESMNSGCAVVASHSIGAVPFLINNKENGLIFRSGAANELYEKVRFLIDNPTEKNRLSCAAYETIVNEWNAENAALRLVRWVKCVLNGKCHPLLFDNGPCSVAELISDDWF